MGGLVTKPNKQRNRWIGRGQERGGEEAQKKKERDGYTREQY